MDSDITERMASGLAKYADPIFKMKAKQASLKEELAAAIDEANGQDTKHRKSVTWSTVEVPLISQTLIISQIVRIYII